MGATGPLSPAHPTHTPARSRWIAGVLVLLAALGGLSGIAFGALVRLVTARISFEAGSGLAFFGGPALLAAGWTMLALWRRGHRRWLLGGPAATLLAQLPAAEFLPPLTLPTAGIGFYLAVAGYELLGLIAGPVLAALFTRLTWPGVAVSSVAWLGASLVAGVVGYAAILVAPASLPLLLVLPLLLSRRASDGPGGWPADGRLRLGYVVLPAAQVGGLLAVLLLGGQ
jgi:hypothetical protein